MQVLQTKDSVLKELLMFLRELASESVLANRILASVSLAKEPIGWYGIVLRIVGEPRERRFLRF